MSLNAFAKAFVPGGAPASSSSDPAAAALPAPFQPPAAPAEPAFYRYQLNLPLTRGIETEEFTQSQSLNLLLLKRTVSAVMKGGTGVAQLNEFVDDFFVEPLNVTQNPAGKPTGFFASREILSPSSPEVEHGGKETGGGADAMDAAGNNRGDRRKRPV